jgi:hypothetical protein
VPREVEKKPDSAELDEHLKQRELWSRSPKPEREDEKDGRVTAILAFSELRVSPASQWITTLGNGSLADSLNFELTPLP